MSKKLVDSDYKNNRVKDPTRITPKQETQIKKYTKDFFDKVVAQKRAHDKKKAERRAERAKQAGAPVEASTPPAAQTDQNEKKEDLSDADPALDLSDDEGDEESKRVSTTPATPADSMTNGDGGLKRKRNTEDGIAGHMNGDEATPSKRQKSETPPPPPPPPPPAMMPPTQSDNAQHESAMEVDDEPGSMTNGHAFIHNRESAAASSTFEDSPPPPPPLTNRMNMDASDMRFHDEGNVSAETPNTDPTTPGLGPDSAPDDEFLSMHLHGVQGIQVHHGD